jgi:thioesterase domain-containing protein
VSSLVPLASAFPPSSYDCYGLQCTRQVDVAGGITAMADQYIDAILPKIIVDADADDDDDDDADDDDRGAKPFVIGGYSFGAAVAIEICLRLQQLRPDCIPSALILLDGSHSFVASHTGAHKNKFEKDDMTAAFAESMCSFILQLNHKETYASLMTCFKGLDRDAMLEVGVDKVRLANPSLEKEDIAAAASSFFDKMVAADAYKPASKVSKSTPVLLIRASESSTNSSALGKDYGLSSICEGILRVKEMKGSHQSFIAGGTAAAGGAAAAAGGAAAVASTIRDFIDSGTKEQ